MPKSNGKIEVNHYYMSLHLGLCAYSPGLKFLGIKFGEKYAARTTLPDGTTLLYINKQDLFGGDKKEGGVEGHLWWLDGNPEQVMPAELCAKMGRTPSTVSGSRGFASIFLTEPFPIQPGRASTGFYLGTNNPYLKKITVRVRRPSLGLNQTYALIQLPNDSEGNQQFASNGAHIIYECMTNTDWGMGETASMFNKPTFEAAAVTLFNEKFGLNLIWKRQSTIEEFIHEVQNHIQASIYIDPTNGKWSMKLLRADYDINTLKQINPSNAKLSGFKLKTWGQVSNEIVVTWTNPESGEEETVSAQDPAAIAIQGSITSDSRNYYAVQDPALAASLAERELATVVHPIATCEAEVSREFWETMIYDVVKLSWPEYQVEQGFYRVSKATKSSDDRTIKLSLYEDVFSLAKAVYLSPVGTGWVSQAQDPQPLTFYHLGTAPAYLTVEALGLTDITDLIYPEAISSVIGTADNTDTAGYDLMVQTTNNLGNLIYRRVGDQDQALRTSWETLAVIPAEAVSTVALPSSFFGNTPSIGDFVLIGSGIDSQTEIGAVTNIVSGVLTISRGLLDTVPRSWPATTRLWFIPVNGAVGDRGRHSAFETVTYKLRTRTSKGLLSKADTPAVTVTIGERPHLPLRPANVKVNTIGFGSINLSGGDAAVTWRTRNRITEANQCFLWTEASTTAEIGQTTTVRILNAVDRSVVYTSAGNTGTSVTLTHANFGVLTDAIVQVLSVRDGFESLQAYELSVTV